MSLSKKTEDPAHSSFPRQLSRKKRFLFAAIIILVGFSGALILGELIIRYRHQYIRGTNDIDEGMTLYDRTLGWKLAPNWKGGHSHYDFEVGYSTNSYGFRGEFRLPEKGTGLCYAFVGDSFTFSLGVNDHETFVHLLNERDKEGNAYLNFGEPGFSTDQEYLLIRERIFDFSPDVIFLVVYLANDLFDNELPFPLQADHAKPYFEITPAGLILGNTPVPLGTKPDRQARSDLWRAVLGRDIQKDGLIARYLGRSELLRLLGLRLHKTRDPKDHLQNRFKNALRLFRMIIERLREECALRKIELQLVLMPGRSFVERPGSPSEQFQDYFRRKIVDDGKGMKVKVMDLALFLRERYQKTPGRWYYPNEGHLTPEGQRIVADIIGSCIANLKLEIGD